MISSFITILTLLIRIVSCFPPEIGIYFNFNHSRFLFDLIVVDIISNNFTFCRLLNLKGIILFSILSC